jgi:threonine synthase
MTITSVARTTSPAKIGLAHALKCRECGAQYPLDASYACFECFGPLEVAYERSTITREQIEAGPQSMWRYEALLPVVTGASGRPGLNPGLTKLVRADNLAAALGAKAVWVKDDSGNPTHS